MTLSDRSRLWVVVVGEVLGNLDFLDIKDLPEPDDFILAIDPDLTRLCSSLAECNSFKSRRNLSPENPLGIIIDDCLLKEVKVRSFGVLSNPNISSFAVEVVALLAERECIDSATGSSKTYDIFLWDNSLPVLDIDFI
ncbi:hypothetical protein WICPIJ_001180 [Wickerhamomyces pijperi]|uniref:Uncharacterized protein n=1 Tax=Wickerhamomyces pijperi TaxID=599730 RepID=A0A9P8TQV6_WICPI|nr:hypothetical protein WICPIJ_001180 [Wickerhamomyces pijperi]